MNRFGEPSAWLEMEHPFTVQIEYEILSPQAGMRTGFWMYTLEGVLIFVAGDSEDPSWRGIRRPAGLYRSSCIIPGMFLNSGRYSISVAADIQGSEMLFLEHHVISFHIEHTGCTTLDGASRSPGILCPSFDWNISKINSD
jgi:lipopolysaccharide transport system ATP-binding protein